MGGGGGKATRRDIFGGQGQLSCPCPLAQAENQNPGKLWGGGKATRRRVGGARPCGRNPWGSRKSKRWEFVRPARKGTCLGISPRLRISGTAGIAGTAGTAMSARIQHARLSERGPPRGPPERHTPSRWGRDGRAGAPGGAGRRRGGRGGRSRACTALGLRESPDLRRWASNPAPPWPWAVRAPFPALGDPQQREWPAV